VVGPKKPIQDNLSSVEPKHYLKTETEIKITMTPSVIVRLCLSAAFLTVLCPIVTLSRVAALADMDVSVLEDHRVIYSSPKVQTKFQSAAK
jgi:hypothetical protein